METNQLKDLLEGITVKNNEKLEALEAKQAELTNQLETKGAELEEAAERIQDLEFKASQAPQAGAQEVKTLGDMLVNADEFKEAVSTRTPRKYEVKAAASPVTNVVAGTMNQQLAGVMPLPEHEASIYNFLSKIAATSGNVEYIRETSFENATAEQASEGAAKALSKTEYETVVVPIPTIAHYIKVSEQMLADNAAVASNVNARMGSQLLYKVDELVFKGAGQLKGLTDASNFTAFAGKAGDNGYDSIRKCMAAMKQDAFVPTAVILNPVDVAALDVMKTTQKAYVAANPRANNISTVWGLPIIESNHVAAGEFMMIDSSFIGLHLRQGATVEVGFDGDDFTKNLRTIRAELRVGLGVVNKAAVRKGDLTPS